MRNRLAATCTVVLIAATTAGCTIGNPSIGGNSERQTRTVVTTAKPTPGQSSANAEPGDKGHPSEPSTDGNVNGDLTQKLQSIIAAVEANYGGSAGVAIAKPGAGASASPASTAGSLTSDVAWSTAKVPIAMAVVRNGGVDANVTAAITASDNAAAEAMWASLGDPATASSVATGILRDGGDSQTIINATRTRPEFTAFGQTQWTLENQAIFGANMQCVAGGAGVANLMQQIAADQSYGLGNIAGAAFKGGWGPDAGGAYLTRQFGFIPGDAPGEYVGVAIAAKPADGSYATGQAMLNEIAAVLSEQPIKGGTCG